MRGARTEDRRAAIVLAAGASERFGGVPKATLAVAGVPAVVRIVRLARRADFDPVYVVVGRHESEIWSALSQESVQVVLNPDWSDGRTGSVQAGIRAAGTERESLIWPVDHPFVNAKSLDALLRTAARDAMALWFIPTFEGRGGHPILLRAEALRRVLELGPDAPMRGLIPGLGAQVVRVQVDDPGVVLNVDTPQEFSRAIEWWRGQA